MNEETQDKILNSLKQSLIVSCQALEHEPLHSSVIMARMALAAVSGGASGIRANSPSDVKEIKKTVLVPVIGLYKKEYEDSDVYITPTMDEIDLMVASGADIVAMDATNRLRPNGETLYSLFEKVRAAYPDQLFMADCSTLEECLNAQELGFDIVGTTMRSYTNYTKGIKIPDFDLFLALKQKLTVPFIAEGGIWEPFQVRKALDCGAFAVVVGTAITRPQDITKRFADVL